VNTRLHALHLHENADVAGPGTERMVQMIYGFAVSQIVRAFAEFAIADELARAPMTADEIAQRCSCSFDGMSRLLRAGIPLGLVTVDDKSRFHATPLLRTLERNQPGSLWGLGVMLASPGTWQPWGNLVEAVRTGEKQTLRTLGCDLWQHYVASPAEGDAFIHAMAAISSGVGAELARAIDTRSVLVATDIGGSSGALLQSLMAENPKLRGIVFDLPEVIAAASNAVLPDDMQARLSFKAGDFFQAVPEADIHLLKHVLHDWNNEDCIRILRNCRRALRSGGRIVVMELAVGEVNDLAGTPHTRSTLQDLNMLVMLGARERTLTQYSALFAAAGLRIARTVSVPALLGPTTIMETVAC
jgi:O-methyltransferase domain/Dimerisation domain